MPISITDALESASRRITFTPELRDRLRDTYNDAVEKDCDTFVFEGKEFVTDFAKYLLEYLDIRFGEDNAQS